jgi:hypothetical protein
VNRRDFFFCPVTDDFYHNCLEDNQQEISFHLELILGQFCDDEEYEREEVVGV